MPVKVDVQDYVSFAIKLFAQLLGVIDRRIKTSVWGFPSSIEVRPAERSPVISVNDSVNIEHRDNFEHKRFS